jgi:hypothetical protein
MSSLDPDDALLGDELLKDLAQFSLDIIGIVEPTPFADSANALISAGRGDWIGSGLSALGIIPYIGDLAKAGKLGKYAESVTKAIRLARRDVDFARRVRPLFKRLRGALEHLPLESLPKGAREVVERIMRQLDDLLLGELARFSRSERGVIEEVRGMLASPEIAKIREARSAGRSVTVQINGRLVQYEPGLPSSGMTMFGENGFLIGREAFSSEAEFTKTLLHELFRLAHSDTARSGAVHGAQATAETKTAFEFAERAYREIFTLIE